MDYVKELFEKYEIRKSKKEKTEFIEWVKEIAIRNDWDVEIQKGDMGARNIVMGKRILRTETAGITILSIIMFQLEQ